MTTAIVRARPYRFHHAITDVEPRTMGSSVRLREIDLVQFYPLFAMRQETVCESLLTH